MRSSACGGCPMRLNDALYGIALFVLFRFAVAIVCGS